MHSDEQQVFSHRVLLALPICLASGYALLFHARQMMHEGVSLEDGGGWTAVVTGEFLVHVSALAVVLY